MLPEGSLRAEHIWKRFRADKSRWSLREQARYAGARLRHRSDDFWRWSLRDVGLELSPGDSLGLVGPNGSGKSTLLKILTQVMQPYAGRLDVSGRVGALIEVRAGIHPDLTGRENLYLYGQLLGLSRQEVARRFDQIVDFAELDDAIDRQVKFYSSGMQMRLGFSVAAHLDPHILLVDEVLAVGDAAFQQRCHDRMREVLAQGTSLVLVSHDLAAVEATCAQCTLLVQGTQLATGPIRDVLGQYRSWIEESAEASTPLDGPVRLLKVEVDRGEEGSPVHDGPLAVRLTMASSIKGRASLFVGVSEGPATPVFVVRRSLQVPQGELEVDCTVRHLPLPGGRFFVWVGLFTTDWQDLLPWHPARAFDVIGPRLTKAPRGIVRLSAVQVSADWDERVR